MSVELASETTAPAAGPPVTRSASEQVSAVKPRRNMRLVLLGVAMAVVFALLAVWAVNRAGEGTQRCGGDQGRGGGRPTSGV